MSSTPQQTETYKDRLEQRIPAIQGHRMDPRTPLHQLAVKRITSGRDLKIIITAKDSQTGVGKTTAAGWLALTWNQMFTGTPWTAENHGTLHPGEYFQLVSKVGDEYDAGTTIIVDDAEELDARRSMQKLNVQFSQRWMLMRLKQVITIVTLPSPSAIDTRLEELADVWINIERRGRGMVHDIRVNSYGSRNVMTEQTHKFTFPNVASHPELEQLREMKEEKLDRWETDEQEEEEPDPTEIEKSKEREHAQRLRDTTDMTLDQIGEVIGRSASWISRNTNNPDKQ